MYRFRYRSKNVNGFSNWSPIVSVKASAVPSRPPAPMFKTATATSVTLYLFSSIENKGSEITALKILKNAGGNDQTFTSIVSLDSSVKEFTLDVSVPAYSMTAGVIYKFRVQTENAEGPSE